jgi:hypothetical protein
MVAPELRTPEFREYLQTPTDEDSHLATDVYDHLGAFSLLKICEAHPSIKKGSARGGFRVISRLIRFAALLYPDHSESEGIAADPEDLREILLQSAETPVRFANMSNGVNREVEDYFGLARPGVPPNLNDLYRFETNTARGTIFITDDDHFSRAYSAGRAQNPVAGTNERCPMLELTRTVFWPGAVHLAADTPEAFAQSLGIEDN